MIPWLIEASVRHRGLVLLVAALVALGGLWAVRELPVDAIPDLSDVQVIVYTEHPGQSPQVVEDQVTYPLSSALLAVPHAEVVRGYSSFGYSLVYVIFDDDVDLYWARSRVMEALNSARERLPAGTSPQLGPDATGVGWVYIYSLADFSPRAEALRARLDSDRDGTISAGEIPAPDLAALEPGDERGRYGQAALEALFAPDLPASERLDAAPAESVGFLLDGFDADRDGWLQPDELLAAANFRGLDLSELRSVQDWYLRYDLTSLPGVAEVASVGGFVRQYQIEADPEKMRAFGVSLAQIRDAVRRSNQDVGGRLIEIAEAEYMVRGRGYVRSIDDLETIPVAVDPGRHVPVLLRQVARVQLGPAPRRGLVEMDGRGEVVSGVVVMRYGENPRAVIEGVEARLEALKRGLPPGVEVHVSYDRSGLIDRVVGTLRTALIEEIAIVVLVCGVFLLHLRSALVAAVTLPLGVLATALLMRLAGVSADAMSLGGVAIAVGVMVDAAVVMVENLHRRRERALEGEAPDPEPAGAGDDLDAHAAQVVRAAREVGPALFFSLAVIAASFLPVFALEAQEGRLFTPLAWTKTSAMVAACLISVTVIPALMVYLVRGEIRPESAHPLSRALRAAYAPLLRGALRAPRLTCAAAAALAALTLLPWSRLGSEFMPALDEGDLLYMPTTPPGISIARARSLLQQTDRMIASHPQVAHVLGKAGRAETATDPAPLSMLETTILLTPRETWPAGKTVRDVARELDAMVQVPGLTNAWTMPIRTRLDMLATGIKTPVGVKLLGSDLEELSRVGQEIEAALTDLPGTASVYSERVTGGNYADVEVRRADAARFGLTVADVQDVIAAGVGGLHVTSTVEGLERYAVTLRYPRELRDDLEALRRVAVPTPMGHTVPLSQVADIEISKGPPMIKSEDARRTAWIFVDLETSDVGGYVERARAAVEREVLLPEGVALVWSGQYAYMARAAERLAIVVPVTIGLIVILLYLHFRRLRSVALVMGALPFALVGGVWWMAIAGYNLSVAAGVGFIALAGLAAETGVVMLVYLDEARDRYARSGRLSGPGAEAALVEAIVEGAADRLRPKVMTVTTTALGLAPILWGTGAGAEVMRRVAAPMVGGVLSSAALTLLILPAAYLLIERRSLSAEIDAPD